MERKAQPAATATTARENSNAVEAPGIVQGKAIDDHRPVALAQRRLNESIAQSPRIVAQRAQMAMIRGEPVQRADRAGGGRSASSPNHTGLPDTLKAGVESLSGLSMDHVRVHYNSDKPSQLNAHAYAQGGDIHVAPGQERHLPHEAWHVVQQAQGRVKPTMQMKADTAINDDPALESEADALGAQALGVGQALAQQEASPSDGAQSPLPTDEPVSQRVERPLQVVSPSSNAPAQLAKYTWDGARWISDGTGSSSRSVGPKPVGDFVGQVYDDSTGVYSRQAVPFHNYLNPWGFEGFQPEKEEHLPVGRELEGHTGPIQMPLEWVGDLAERLVKEWVESTGITPRAEQNASGHGLDLTFEITAGEIRKLPEALRNVFSSIISSRGTFTTRGGRATTSQLPTVDDSERYLVVFEVKANSAQLSKAQRDADKYVLKQSKTGFGLSARKAIESGFVELFYEVNVQIEEAATQDASFEFTRRDDKTSQGLPKQSDTVAYQAPVPFAHLNSKQLGDAGEQFAKETLAMRGYQSIGSLQKAGGQGVDIVALDPSGHIVFFEVKTHVGSGKKAQLTEREKGQHAFVAEILFHIIGKTGGYEDVPEHIRQQAWEVYQAALYHDQEARENRGEPPVGLGAVNTDAVVRQYLVAQARYYIMDVYFPELGTIGDTAFSVSHWKRKE